MKSEQASREQNCHFQQGEDSYTRTDFEVSVLERLIHRTWKHWRHVIQQHGILGRGETSAHFNPWGLYFAAIIDLSPKRYDDSKNSGGSIFPKVRTRRLINLEALIDD